MLSSLAWMHIDVCPLKSSAHCTTTDRRLEIVVGLYGRRRYFIPSLRKFSEVNS